MRNGIYRSWFSGQTAQGALAVIIFDGHVIASDPSHFYMGEISDNNGNIRATVHARRHTNFHLPAAISEMNEFDLCYEGKATAEVATLKCTIPNAPNIAVTIELVWLSEI
jgi:hypothetical protein